IETQVLFGPFVRGLHHWGASAMVVAIGLHMLQVFLYGAYKPPRELMWMVGVLLLLLTMGFAFTGYLLPWDQNAYWATQVGINMVGSVPFVGTFLVRVMRGGDTLGALTLSRFFAVHILFLPAAIMAPIATWVLPAAFIALLLALPFLDPHHEREPASRPLVISVGAAFLVGVFVLIGLSLRDLQAMKRTDPAVASGKALYERFGCMGCH